MMPSGPCPAEIMIVGEAPGAEEERIGRPFVGASGQELDRMLHEAGLLRSECFVTNVCRVRPPKNEILFSTKSPGGFVCRNKTMPKVGQWTKLGALWVTPQVAEGAELLAREIEKCQPKVIIALGNLSLYLLSGKWGISDWRGSSLRCSINPAIAVLPTYHPAAILRQWSWRAYVISDLKRVRGLCTDGICVPQYNFIIRPHIGQVLDSLAALHATLEVEPRHIACDIETRAGHIACVGIAWSSTDAICIPIMCSERKEGYWSEQEEFYVWHALRTVLCHTNARVSGQNFIYDTQYFWRWVKFVPRLGLDTMVTHHVCWPGTSKGLDVLASLYCEHYVFWKNDSKEWAERQDENLLWKYNCEDAVRTYEVAESLVPTVEKLGLVEPLLFQHRMWWRALFTMITGVRMNNAEKKALSEELLIEATQREQWLQSVLGHPLNVKSPKQMKELFYDDLQLPVQRNRASGLPTLDEEALSKLSTKEPLIRPVVRRILEIRSLSVFRSTFVEGKLDRDGRMRCSYNVAGPETFRFSSSENAFGSGMNLQNVPKGGEADEEPDALVLPNVRKLFIPDPGYEMFDMDLSSADLRVVVWEADEPEMKAMLAAGLDPYTEIAKEFYADPSITKADRRRQTFKSFAHGTNYLGSARGLATRLGLSVREAERTQEWYFNRFSRIKEWQDNLCRSLTRTHTVKNAFGYRRFYFDRIDGTVFNQAAAWIPQSTVGLLINKIWDRIAEEESEVLILLQVHDSLVGQYPIARAAYFRERLVELSKIAVPYADPLWIPTGFKFSTKSWGHCE